MGSRKRLWLSYSWKDNVDEDVDFVAQEIEKRGVEVHQDRFVLVAGQRLWPQIEAAISDPQRSDAWAIFLTDNSLRSEPVREAPGRRSLKYDRARAAGIPCTSRCHGTRWTRLNASVQRHLVVRRVKRARSIRIGMTAKSTYGACRRTSLQSTACTSIAMRSRRASVSERRRGRTSGRPEAAQLTCARTGT
jgi:hypothetical protein